MQRLNQLFRERLLSFVDNQVYATEMVHRFNDVVHVHRLVGSHSNSIRLEDIACLFVGQTATLDMVRVVGQVYLRFMIDAALHLHRFLLTEYIKQRLFILVVFHITIAYGILTNIYRLQSYNYFLRKEPSIAENIHHLIEKLRIFQES